MHLACHVGKGFRRGSKAWRRRIGTRGVEPLQAGKADAGQGLALEARGLDDGSCQQGARPARGILPEQDGTPGAEGPAVGVAAEHAVRAEHFARGCPAGGKGACSLVLRQAPRNDAPFGKAGADLGGKRGAVPAVGGLGQFGPEGLGISIMQ